MKMLIEKEIEKIVHETAYPEMLPKRLLSPFSSFCEDVIGKDEEHYPSGMEHNEIETRNNLRAVQRQKLLLIKKGGDNFGKNKTRR